MSRQKRVRKLHIQLRYLCPSHSVGPAVQDIVPSAENFTPAAGKGWKLIMSANLGDMNNKYTTVRSNATHFGLANNFGTTVVKNHLHAGLDANEHNRRKSTQQHLPIGAPGDLHQHPFIFLKICLFFTGAGIKLWTSRIRGTDILYQRLKFNRFICITDNLSIHSDVGHPVSICFFLHLDKLMPWINHESLKYRLITCLSQQFSALIFMTFFKFISKLIIWKAILDFVFPCFRRGVF